MPDFKQTFQEEVRRLARKELKALDEKINEQKKTINALQKRISELEKSQASAATKTAAAEKVQEAPAQEGRKVRFSPKSLVKFRKKFSLSQKALAILLGVTPFTVSHWEIGKNRPRTVQIEAFNALTKLGKRKLIALVAEKAPGELPVQKKAKAAKAGKPAASSALVAAPAPAKKRGRKKAEKTVTAAKAPNAPKAAKAKASAAPVQQDKKA